MLRVASQQRSPHWGDAVLRSSQHTARWGPSNKTASRLAPAPITALSTNVSYASWPPMKQQLRLQSVPHPRASLAPRPRAATVARVSSTHLASPSRSMEDDQPAMRWQERWESLSRGADFWTRATGIYGTYKVTQLRAAAMRLGGATPEQLKEELWHHQHAYAGEEMYKLAISLRGFYLKVLRGTLCIGRCLIGAGRAASSTIAPHAPIACVMRAR